VYRVCDDFVVVLNQGMCSGARWHARTAKPVRGVLYGVCWSGGDGTSCTRVEERMGRNGVRLIVGIGGRQMGGGVDFGEFKG